MILPEVEFFWVVAFARAIREPKPISSHESTSSQPILAPRPSISFGHMVGGTEALVAAITGGAYHLSE